MNNTLLYLIGALVSLIVIKGFINFNFAIYMVLFLGLLASIIFVYIKEIKKEGFEINPKKKKNSDFLKYRVLFPIFIAFMIGKLTAIVEISILPAIPLFDFGEGFQGTSHLLNYLITYIPILLLLFNSKSILEKYIDFESTEENKEIDESKPYFLEEKVTFGKFYGKKWKDLQASYLCFEIDKLEGENKKRAQIMLDYIDEQRYK